MSKHFTITINDDNGIYQFNLHKFAKKATVYILMFLTFIALLAAGTILYLNYSADQIDKKRVETEIAYKNLKIKTSELDESIKKSQELLDKKKQELDEVADSLTKIEEMIGLSDTGDAPLQERISATKITSQQMATLLQFIPNGSPIEYKGINSRYGYRIHPTLDKTEYHQGDDLKAEMDTPVYATADAMVEYAGLNVKSGYGNLVILQHNYGFKTYFGHLNKIVIKSGQFIKKGTLIAYTGNTGLSNGPHLHYEIRFTSRTVNPFWFIKWNVQNYNEIFEKEQTIPWQSLITATANIIVEKPTQTLPSSQQVLLSRAK